MSTRLPHLLYLGVCVTGATLITSWPLSSHAACTPVVTAGDDTTTCDSGSTGGFTDLLGNNTFIMPVGGSGQITGPVGYGIGNDLVDVHSGTMGSVDMGHGTNIFRIELNAVVGNLTQGDGADIAQVSGGTVGAVSQGNGIDSYAQSGGTVQSVAQGDGRDIFNMSGGTITGAFEDGDVATQSAGTIGRVDMKLDNNFYTMTGGQIIGNLVTGFGLDTITVSNGTIGGNISVSGGNDEVNISGGEVRGQILMSFGDDHFNWTTGGTLRNTVNMGAGNDIAVLKDLTEATLGPTPLLDGGLGADTLTFDNTQSATPGRYANWETVRLDNNSRFTHAGDFVLGDSETGTGTFNIDGSSVLQVSQGAIKPLTAGQLVTLNNSGLIDMTSASSAATDSLTVNGNYNGNNGQLALQSVLASDGAASDKLVVSQGTLQGSTGINITNLGGPGDLTLQNGIQVVEALNGATASDLAFTLRGAVSAGAYEYYLFKGGVTAGTEQNWYLRSAVVAPPLPEPNPEDPTLPPVPLPNPVPGGGTPELPVVEPGEEPLPIYRQEVPSYATLLPEAHQLVLGALGTFHERQGDQSRQQPPGAFPTGWGRVYASSSRQSMAGTVNPRFDGSLSGFQVGSDLYAKLMDNGQVQRVGFFVGHSRLQGNVDGFNGGFQHRDSGKSTMRGDSLGLYWTLIDPYGWYVDLVLMGTRLNGKNESDRGLKLKTKGHDVMGSAEIGVPLPISERWVIEPQAQVIVHRTSLDDENDRVSDVSFESDTSVTTRLGARLRGSYSINALPVQPYVRANVWHTSSGKDRVSFNEVTDIDTEQKSTTMDVSAGLTAQVSQGLSVYGEMGYDTQLDSNARNGRKATIGLRLDF